MLRKRIANQTGLLAVAFLSSCSTLENPCEQTGVVKDFLGLEGCTLIIEADQSKEILVPVNILEFGLPIFNEQKVRYSFRISPEDHPCFQGIPVILQCLDVESLNQ